MRPIRGRVRVVSKTNLSSKRMGSQRLRPVARPVTAIREKEPISFFISDTSNFIRRRNSPTKIIVSKAAVAEIAIASPITPRLKNRVAIRATTTSKIAAPSPT